MNLTGLFEPEAEQRFREAAAKEPHKPTFDTKSTALVSIAISLRRIADCLEGKTRSRI